MAVNDHLADKELRMARLYPTDDFTHDPEHQRASELKTLKQLGRAQ